MNGVCFKDKDIEKCEYWSPWYHRPIFHTIDETTFYPRHICLELVFCVVQGLWPWLKWVKTWALFGSTTSVDAKPFCTMVFWEMAVSILFQKRMWKFFLQNLALNIYVFHSVYMEKTQKHFHVTMTTSSFWMLLTRTLMNQVEFKTKEGKK